MALRYRAAARTTDGQAVTAARGILGGVLLTSGSDAATVAVYDGTSTSGVLLAKLALDAGNQTTGVELPGDGVVFDVGLFVDVSGTSPTAVVFYA